MTDDYIIYRANKNAINKMVFAVYKKYQPLIQSKAKKYEFNSGGRIDQEDFASDVYVRLHYFLSYIKEEKIDPNTFMFYSYVKYAISSVFHKSKKVSSTEFLLINDETHQNYYEAPEFNSILSLNVEPFMNSLTSRQRKVLNYVRKGETYTSIQKKLKCSYGTIAGDIWRAKQLAKDYF